MAITGRWPRAVFYDSKTTLFNWAGSWRGAAAQLLKKHDAKVPEQEFVETWVRNFEGLHRRAAFFRYTQVTDIVREALANAYKMHGIRGDADDVEAFLDLQAKVELFPDTEAALTNQQNLGVKVFIYSDVETKYLDMYVAKFKKFKADFVGTHGAGRRREAESAHLSMGAPQDRPRSARRAVLRGADVRHPRRDVGRHDRRLAPPARRAAVEGNPHGRRSRGRLRGRELARRHADPRAQPRHALIRGAAGRRASRGRRQSAIANCLKLKAFRSATALCRFGRVRTMPPVPRIGSIFRIAEPKRRDGRWRARSELVTLIAASRGRCFSGLT